MQRRAPKFCFLSTGVFLAFAGLAGCVSRPVADSPAARAPRDAVLYREAQQQFAAHNYAAALTRVDAILASPGLTAIQQTYYERQRQICRDALSGRKSPVAVTAAPMPRTVSASAADCGPRALLLVCEPLQITPPTLAQVRRLAGTTGQGTQLSGLARAAQKLGLAASGVQMDRDALAGLDTPAIAWVDGSHYVAVLAVHTSLTGETSATVHDPNDQTEKSLPVEELLRRSGGVLLVLDKAPVKVATRQEKTI